MNIKKLLEEYYVLEKEAQRVASKYANKMMDCGGMLYTGINFKDQEFSFQYGPATHGMTTFKSLPISLLWANDLEERLNSICEKDKREQEEERKKNRCPSCGSYNLKGHNFNTI